jgi:hypothetical protein
VFLKVWSLFVLYVNDIVKVVQHSTVYFFVDGSLLSNVGIWKQHRRCLEKMHEDLAKLAESLNFNKLKLNVDKTKL